MLTLRSSIVAEEVYNATTVVPWAIVSTIMVNGVMGLALLIALLFCLGNIDAALNTPTGVPFIEIFAQATNSNAAGCGFKRGYGHCFSASLVISQRRWRSLQSIRQACKFCRT
jgi:hypothetical protein